MTDISTATDPILAAYLEPCLATVQLPTPSATPDAAEQLEVHVRNLARGLAEIQVPEADVERVLQAVRDSGHAGGRSLVAVVRADDVLQWPSGAALPLDIRPGPVPALVDVLARRQEWVPHAVVVVDRVGADVTVVESVGGEVDLAVDGAESHITKSNPGGWSQRRFQQRAEEHWQDNAQQVVSVLEQVLDGAAGSLVLLAGDRTQCSVLIEQLPERLASAVVLLEEGSRAADGSDEAVLEQAVDQAVRSAAHEVQGRIVAEVEQAVGSGVGAAGRTDVLAALFEHRVDALLVAPSAAETITAHVGEEPDQVAADGSVLHDLGLDAARVPLVDAALRGAAATGARVVVVDTAPEWAADGLAATLRGE